MFGENQSKGITQKLRKGDQSFFSATRRLDLIHISGKNNQRGIT